MTWGTLRYLYTPATPSRAETWVPPVDVYETRDGFVIQVELPGVKKEEVALELEENSLVLKGERRPERDVKEGVHHTERVYGPFQRSFNLPTNIETSGVKASFREGVLEIVLPKAEEAKPRHIDIAA